MLAWMDGWHGDALDEVERFHCEGFVKVFFLNVLLDTFILHWLPAEICGAEKHSWGVVVLVIDNVHGIVSELFLVEGLFLLLGGMEDDQLLTVLPSDLFFCSGGQD